MDQSTQELFNSRDFLLSMNVSNQHYLLPKDVFNTICSLGISKFKPTRRGKKGGKKYRQKQAELLKSKSACGFSLFQLNCQGVKGKATQGIITDLIEEHDMEIFALTETWLADNESDEFILSSLTPPGYDIYSVPRGGGDAHGGVAVIYKKDITIVSKYNNQERRYKSIEFVTLSLKVDLNA